MAVFNFALECPKCGSVNTASNFLFAKKVIKCGTCGEEIDVKQSRLISKECPHCGKVFIYDQAKKEATCPHCNQKMHRYDAETVQYKIVTVNCPQCGCGFETDKTRLVASCPLCKERFNLVQELAKATLVKDNTISVIKYEGDNDTLVWKHPIEDFNMGSQLIVHESQEAIVYINGQAIGPYAEGRYTLDTENIPILKTLFDIPTGGQSPFHCEVYYVNKTVHLGMKWGTPDKVRFLEPVSGIPLEIGASGEIALQVSDGRKLLAKLVGTTGGLSNKDVLSNSESVNVVRNGEEKTTITKTLQSFFRAPLVTGVKSYLAQTIKEQQLNILEIDSKLDELSYALRDKIAPRFEEYGLTIPNFYVTTILLPTEDPGFKDIVAIIHEKYRIKSGGDLAIQKAETDTKVKVAEREAIIAEKITDYKIAEIENATHRMQEETKIDLEKQRGFSEAEVMARKGYSGKDELELEKQKAWAAGIGNMGSNGGGSAGGNMLGDIATIGVAMAAAGHVQSQMSSMLNNAPSQTPAQISVVQEEKKACQNCGEDLPANAKFCLKCGEKVAPPIPEGMIICPECDKTVAKGKFCSECGYKFIASCPKCGKELVPGAKFCLECGEKL